MDDNKNKEIAIEVNNLRKNFNLIKNKNSTLKQVVVNIVRKNHKTIYKVLNGISFKVYKGDFLGIVGRNGSGKSTLLKLLAGVYTPTAGHIKINGGLTPFIELGVGFNPELSGHDNVYLNGALLGFTRKQMDTMYDEIVAFAELEPFMDQKLKNYSSGMQVRLAFSIAVKADNDILIFDEVLAVGDSNFQEKCVKQFKKLKKSGKTIILVTHSMDMVEKFCNRAILLNAGEIEYDGKPDGAIDKYQMLNINSIITTNNMQEKIQQNIAIQSINVLDSTSKPSIFITKGDYIDLDICVSADKDYEDIFAAIRICESENQFPVIGFDSVQDNTKINLKEGVNHIKIRINDQNIIRGKYYIIVGLYDDIERNISYSHYNGMNQGKFFIIKKSDQKVGILETKRQWL